jgi:hypothetical protein
MNELPCPDAELKAEKYWGKTLEKLEREKHASVKIIQVNTLNSKTID